MKSTEAKPKQAQLELMASIASPSHRQSQLYKVWDKIDQSPDLDAASGNT
jgi:hypothetical protein